MSIGWLLFSICETEAYLLNIRYGLGGCKELHHKKAITLLFGVRRSRLGPIQSQAVLKRPEWRASAKLAESPVMIIKSVFSI